MVDITRLTGGNTPANGGDPRTFPAIWNATATSLESALAEAPVTVSATAPSSPSNGDLWWDTINLGLFMYYTGGETDEWIVAGGGGGGGSIEISPTAPVSPSSGDMWWDSDNGNLYIYYDDGSSQQWVAANGPQVFVGTTAPAGYQGQLWFDSTSGRVYIYYDDGTSAQWVAAVGEQLAGTVLQVVSTHYTGTFSTSSSTPADVPGFSATITPRDANSKILVLFQSWVGYTALDNYPYFLMKRNGTSIGTGASATGTQIDTFVSTPALARDTTGTQVYKLLNASRSYVDSPATASPVTYQVQFAESFAGTSYVNRTANASDNVYTQFPGSDLTLMEIAS